MPTIHISIEIKSHLMIIQNINFVVLLTILLKNNLLIELLLYFYEIFLTLQFYYSF